MNTKCYQCLEIEANKHKKETIPIVGCPPYIGKQVQKRIMTEEQMRLLIYQVIDTMFSPPQEMTLVQSNKEREEYKLYGDLHGILQKIAQHYEENYPIKLWKH
jgi:hypothetical protein